MLCVCQKILYQYIQKGDLAVLLPHYQLCVVDKYAAYPYTRDLPNKTKQLIEHNKQGYQAINHYI